MKTNFAVLLAAFLFFLAGVFSFTRDAAALPANFQDTVLWSGLDYPTAIAFAPNGKVFIAEKSGLIKVFDSVTDPTPSIFADLRSQVQNYSDRGLLGIVVDPQFPVRPYVYVLYTMDGPIGSSLPFYNDNCTVPDICPAGSRLSKLTASGNTMVAEQVLLESWCQIENSHSVGMLAFGPDGALYVSHGDGASYNYVDFGQDGGCGDPVNEGGALRSQDLRTSGDPVSYNGSLLRLNPDTGGAFAGNPLAGGATTDDDPVIAHGFRNPYRYSIDSQTGAVWVADVGWNEWEEVDYIASPTSAPVSNFGWPCYEGPYRQNGYDAANVPICENLYTAGTAKTPYFTYSHNGNSRAISGIAVYRGTNFPSSYDGALFYADYTQGWIRAIVPGPNGLPDINQNHIDFIPSDALTVDLKVGPDGFLYYVDISGSIHQVRYSTGNTPPTAQLFASADSGALPLTVNFNGAASADPDPGDVLQYSWDLNGDGVFGDSTIVNPSFTYTVARTVLVGLRVTDSQGASNTATTTIYAGNRAPVVTISAPTASTLFNVGDTISFSGGATDPDVGVLPASALTWETVLLHCALNDPNQCHEHSIQSFNGVYNGSITALDHEYPSRIVIRLTGVDPAVAALTRTVSVTLEPRTTTWTFTSQPSGLQLAVYGATATTPFTRTAIVNAQSTISAPTLQQIGTDSYQFASWSDAGSQTHTVTAASMPQTFHAVYTPSAAQSTWRSWDVVTQNASPQGSVLSNTNLAAFIEFYESTNDSGVTKGTLFSNFVGGIHPDSFNHTESFWSSGVGAAAYPYAGKSSVDRGADVSEGNVPSPSGVRDLQLFPPNNNHYTVAAFRVPQNGTYTIADIGVRKVDAQGDSVRLHVINNSGTDILTLTANNDQDWVTSAGPLTINNAAAGEYIYFAVDRNGTSLGDAAEISWSISATFTAPPPQPACTLTPNPASVTQGASVALSWTTSDATTFSLDQGIGSQAFIVSGSVSQAPASTTTYTGTASGAGGSAQCSATVTVTPVTPTCSLSILPVTINQGGSAMLSWTSQNAVAGSIDQGIGNLTTASGSLSVSPSTTTTYTGTAIGEGGATTTCSATLSVTVPAATCTLNASPTSITQGSSSSLSWTSQNATAVSINQGIGSVTPVASGSRSVSPTATTTYTATVTGPGGSNTCARTITVTQPLPTCSLNASPTTITSGGSSTLSWTSANATAISINQGIGSVTPVASGSRSVSPTATTTYTATVTGPGGTNTCTRTVTVSAPVPTCSLNATPTSIPQGNSTSLSWTSANATAISINQGIGSVTPVASGSRSVSPAVNTTYTATVTGAGGTGTCSRTVTVTAPLPSCALSMSPASITRGSSATLSWTSQNAVSGSINPGVGALTSASGSVTVSPTATTTYTGTANGSGGTTGTCTATLTVTP